MKNVTVEAVLASSEFMKIALKGAIEMVAKVNGQSIETTKEAFSIGVESVQKEVAKLVVAAAEQTAKEMSA